MNQLKTKAIVLSRRNYRESDRIINVITPHYGKLGLIAKGSRAMKSKLAGGIELFTVNDISFIRGRSDLSTLVSSRLETNYPNIIKDIERVQLGYELLKLTDKSTEDEAGDEYYELLAAALGGLDDLSLNLELVRLWFLSRLIAISGHAPNLLTDNRGGALKEGGSYGFDTDSMAFFVQQDGRFRPEHIKYLRIAFASGSPGVLGRINGTQKLSSDVLPLVGLMRNIHFNG